MEERTMATTFASLGLDHLSEDDKWELVRDLNDELEETGVIPGGFATKDELHAELLRRAAADDADPEAARDFNTVYDEIMAELDASEKVK
jgi:putative addiction module component (TIGR02574 family)